jgi:hypothetical protein
VNDAVYLLLALLVSELRSLWQWRCGRIDHFLNSPAFHPKEAGCPYFQRSAKELQRVPSIESLEASNANRILIKLPNLGALVSVSHCASTLDLSLV